jgi:hypothetical protein
LILDSDRGEGTRDVGSAELTVVGRHCGPTIRTGNTVKMAIVKPSIREVDLVDTFEQLCLGVALIQ